MPLLNFDSRDGASLIRQAYDVAKDHQFRRNVQYGRDYLLNRAFVDMSNRDDSIPHIAVPKIWNITETNSAREMKAHFGSAPFIESETEFDNMREVVELQNKVLHDFLKRGNFYFEAALANKIKCLYGTSFMECEPYRRKRVISIPHDNGLGGYNIQHIPYDQLALRITTLAPWEVMFDPLWYSLENPEGCAWCIKIGVTTRRQIKMQAMADPNAYPGLDLDALGRGGLSTEYYNQHTGFNILEDFGLQKPKDDDDLCVLLRWETPDRYIWCIDGNDILRDGPNPYHDSVNLSRWINVIDPHTQNRGYGIGDAKPNEIIQNMQSDALSLFFQVWAYSTQPAMLFREGPVNQDDLIMSLGNRIPVHNDSDSSKIPLEDMTHTLTGAQVTRDQVEIFPILDRVGDLAARQFEPMRGQPSQGQHTLGEIGIAQQAGDIITEARVRLGEEVFIDSFRRKALAIIDGFATYEDLIPILGGEDAYKVFTANPDRVPGGCNLTLRASTSISDMNQKLNTDVALQPVLEACLAMGPAGLSFARKMLRDARWDKNEIDEIIGAAEQQMQQQMQMQQEQAQAEQQMKQQEMQARMDGENKNRDMQSQQSVMSTAKDLAIAKMNAESKKQGGNGTKPVNRMAR